MFRFESKWYLISRNFRESKFLFFPNCARPIFNFYEERSIQFYAFLLQSYSIHSASYVNSPVQSKNSSFWASLELKPICKIYEKYNFYFSVQCNRGERWVGGEFISAERVVVFSDDGKAYLYKLPTNCIVESKDFKNRSKTQSGKLTQFFREITV